MTTTTINSTHLHNLREELQRRGATTIASDLGTMAGQVGKWAEATLSRSDENYNSTMAHIADAHRSIATAVEVCRICEAIIADSKE